MVVLKEVAVDKIQVMKNIRTEMGDLSYLMQSIKQHGLLEPIGIWETEPKELVLVFGGRRLQAVKKLGWKTITAIVSKEKITEQDFLLLNTVENIQREDISPVELGRICKRLKELGLSETEISARLAIPITRVRNCLVTYKAVPEKYRTHIGFISGSTHKKGKIPISVSAIITNARINKENKERCFGYAKVEELTMRKARILVAMLTEHIPFRKAIKELDKYRTLQLHLVVNKEKLNELIEAHSMKATRIFYNIITGKMPPKKDLIVAK